MLSAAAAAVDGREACREVDERPFRLRTDWEPSGRKQKSHPMKGGFFKN